MPLALGPSGKFPLQRTAAHHHEGDLRRRLRDLHQYANALFLADAAVKHGIAGWKAVRQRLMGIDIGVLDEVVLFYDLRRVKPDLRQQPDLVVVQADVPVDLAIIGLQPTVQLEVHSHQQALQPGALVASIADHAQVVPVSAAVAQLRSPQRCGARTDEAGVVERRRHRHTAALRGVQY